LKHRATEQKQRRLGVKLQGIKTPAFGAPRIEDILDTVFGNGRQLNDLVGQHA
jgi:hypothetical protein